MEKPEDIPQRTWDNAENLAMQMVEWLTPSPADPDTEYVFTQHIARAILSAVEEEREACAKIADPIETDGRMSDYEKQCFDLRDVISQNIRNRKGA